MESGATPPTPNPLGSGNKKTSFSQKLKTKLKLKSTVRYITVAGAVTVTTFSGIFLYNRSQPVDPVNEERSTNSGQSSTVEFDGLDDFLQVENNPQLAGGRTYTIEAWIYPTAKKLGGIVSKRRDSRTNTSYSFLVAPVRGSLRLFFKVNREDDDFYGNTVIPLNEWTHVAAVFDGDDKEFQRKRIYINGKLEKRGKSESRKVHQFKTFFGIGMLLGNGASNFSGNIDEVRFWNRALSEEEIKGHMCQTLEGSEAGLLGYWRFDGEAGNIVHNYSPIQGLDAEFNNMVPEEAWINSVSCPGLAPWTDDEPLTSSK